MAANPYQFQYPEKGWSTGRMRKRGQLAMMPSDMMPGQGMLDPMRGKGLMGGGVAGPTQLPQAPMETVNPHVKERAIEGLSRIKEHLNDIQLGDATMGGLRKLLKKLGWTGNPEKGEFVDPEGKTHNITADENATGSEVVPSGPRR